MKPYPKYKDSGIEWIVEIPEFWEVRKLKYCDYVIMGQSPNSDTYNDNFDGLPFLQGNADFTEKNPKARIWCDSSNKVALKNDILLSVRAPVGAVNIADQPYGIGRGLCSIRSKKSNLKYLYFIILNISEKLNSIATGTTYLAVSVDDIKRTYIPQPPLPEQKVIANFLDRKTKQIDTLIRKKEKLIELLKEECTAIINHAVTKGLNPDVPMKNSVVEWIGEIPQHWEISKYKYYYKSNMGQTILKEDLVNDGKYPVYSATEKDLIFGYINNAKIILKTGDFVIPARGISIGYVTFVDRESTCTQTTIYSKKIKTARINTNFTFYYLKGLKKILFQFDRTAIPQITVAQVNQNPLIIPPLTEQKAIANFLDQKTKEIDNTIEKHKKSIELLKEYRTSLISEVVTGKIDVRQEVS